MYNKLKLSLLFALVCMMLLTGCSLIRWEVKHPKVPAVESLNPIYELPTISLAEKETVLFNDIMTKHLNEQGYLLYLSYLPLSKPRNYKMSHNSADLPAWHGFWMASLAMKLAVEPSLEVEALLKRSVEGLRANFEATGVTGLLTRAYLKYDGDRPLHWMATEEQRPTKFWQKGENGFWFRNGVAKGHYARAVLGLATVIGLEKRGAIFLQPETSMLVRKTLLEIAHYLIDNNYRIIDASGKVTEFGKLSNWRWNGFNGLVILAMLRTGKTLGDEKCAREYDRLVKFDASTAVATILGGLGNVYAAHGRHIMGHYSDDEVIYTNAFVLFLHSTEEDERVMRDVRYSLKKMWQFLRHSRKSYMTFIHAVLLEVSEEEMGQALETLRMFPDDKRVISNLEIEETKNVQYITNQPISSHYWKSNYFKKAVLTGASERMDVEYSGQDYLLAYWLGRYFGLISEEDANAPVRWENL